MNVMEVQHAVYLQGDTKENTCKYASQITQVLYLHHPLKHVGQREEGDQHIFGTGLQCVLSNRSHGCRGAVEGRGIERESEQVKQRQIASN